MVYYGKNPPYAMQTTLTQLYLCTRVPHTKHDNTLSDTHSMKTHTLLHHGRQLLPLALVLGLLISIPSCQKQIVDEETQVIEAAGSYGPSNEQITLPTAFISDDQSPIATAARSRCNNLVSPDQALLLLVGANDLESNTETITAALERGAILAITNPDKTQTAAWCSTHGYSYAGDETNTDDKHLICAFNNHFDYYFLDDFMDDNPSHDYNTLINSFVSWVNTQSQTTNTATYRTKSASTNDIKELFHAQTITHTSHIGIVEGELAHVALSKPDRLTKYTTVDASYTIYPLYSFEANTTSGDFYVVEGTFTIHNAGMYQGQWTKRHGGVKARLCGFYLSAFNIDVTFCDNQMKPYSNVDFPAGATPVPETTIGATTYTSGFSWGLSGSISGGFANNKPTGSLTFGGNVGWNNSTSRQISDLNIEKNAPNGAVNYTLTVNNLPTKGKHDVPSIAKSDLTLNQTWVWHVPATRDNSTENFAIQVNIKPTYQGYHWYSSHADFATRTFNCSSAENDMNFSAKLIAPNRIPTGQLTLVNSSSTYQYLDNIQIWLADNTDPQPNYTITQTIASSSGGAATEGASASLWLPVGDYRIELTRYNLNAQGERTDQLTVKTLNNVTVTLAGNTVVDGGSGTFIAK